MTFSLGGRCWDLDCIRDRFSRWWRRREERRHLDALAAEIDARPWPVLTEPAAEPEWSAEAILRSARPHLYASDGVYWRDAWADFALWMAAWRAESAALRAECGLAA